jgi:hypothetical protein
MNEYTRPEIKTLSVGEILETLGPVSCGSGVPLGSVGSFAPAMKSDRTLIRSLE